MKESFKNSFIFIGTVIGAGFATGQEVALYFGSSHVSVCIFAGMLLGILCTIFMMIGEVFKNKNFYAFMMFICSFISFIAMFSAIKTMFVQYNTCWIITISIVIFCAIIVKYGIEKVKLVNAIAVPIIICFIAYLFLKCDNVQTGLNLNFMNAVTYSGLNIIIASGVMTRVGKSSKKTCCATGIISAIILSCMLVMITRIVNGTNAEMPLLVVAENMGVGGVSKFVVFLAIFTTMLSSMDTAVNIIGNVIRKKELSIALLIILSAPFVIMFSFENIVSIFYPILSMVGITMLIIILLLEYRKKCGKIFDNKI